MPQKPFPLHSILLALCVGLNAAALGFIAPGVKPAFDALDVPLPGLTLKCLLVADLFLAAWPLWLAGAACGVVVLRRSPRWTIILSAASIIVLLLMLLLPAISLYQGIGRQK